MNQQFESIRVLCMEDETGLARLVEKTLKRAGGYSIDIVHNGKEGIALYSRNEYDILIVDHKMPVCDGLDVLRFISLEPNHPPIIMVTGHGDEAVAVEAMKLGVSDYLIKDAEARYLTLLPDTIQRALEHHAMACQKQKAEEALRESESRLKMLFEQSPVGILTADARGVIASINPAYLAMLGPAFAAADIIGNYDIPALNPIREPNFDPMFSNLIEHGRSFDAVMWVTALGGRRMFAYFRGAALRNPDGRISGIIWMASDWTQQKKTEEDRKHFETQIQHAQKFESLGVLAGGVAHDFNNILMGILGHTDLALMEVPPESHAHANLEQIEKSTLRAAELVKQILAYSGQGMYAQRALDISAVVSDMVFLLEVSISKKTLLRLNLAENLPSFSGDPAQIRQVIMNLVINASEACGDSDGIISISTGVMEANREYLSNTYLDDRLPEGFYIYVQVEDTGHGMDEETMACIFDPFFTTKFTGRGLGLAAAIGIVRSHAGAINVASTPGKGSSFRILFPRALEPSDSAPSPTAPNLAEGSSGVVLVVDDEETVCAIAKMTLQKWGYQVLTALDGRDAVEIFRQHADSIDLILLDMNMPHMNGQETFMRMREIRSDIKVVIASGCNEEEAIRRFRLAGPVGFIKKPYRPVALIETVSSAIGKEW